MSKTNEKVLVSFGENLETPEDVIMEIEVKKELSHTFVVRVHKDHIEHFDVEDYLGGKDLDDYWGNSNMEEKEYHRIGSTKLVSGLFDYFYDYVCSEGSFDKGTK